MTTRRRDVKRKLERYDAGAYEHGINLLDRNEIGSGWTVAIHGVYAGAGGRPGTLTFICMSLKQADQLLDLLLEHNPPIERVRFDDDLGLWVIIPVRQEEEEEEEGVNDGH
jgi:hypothetical protein